MTLLTPLGLLALLSIVALIIIYIIRPNYQQKFVSSTYVWKLALKRKKKRLPTSKLRNILLILCQVLILASLTALLTTPSQNLEVEVDAVEVVAIVDASASMRTKNADNVSRFERALEKVVEVADEAFDNGGFVSLMFAGEKNEFAVEKITNENRYLFDVAVDEALGYDDDECTYGVSDLDGAILMCQETIKANPSTRVYVYSDIDYGYIPAGELTYERIYDSAESNLAILDAYSENINNYLNFHIDVASYGRDAEILLNLNIVGANVSTTKPKGENVNINGIKVTCTDSVIKSLVLCSKSLYNDEDKAIAENMGITYLSIEDCYPQGDKLITDFYSYSEINISIDTDSADMDSYSYDNNFNIYGGKKPVLNLLYASTDPNIFMQVALPVVKNTLSDHWDIVYTETKIRQGSSSIPTDGYDIYIYEHAAPVLLPNDGLVIIIDPPVGGQPAESDFKVTGYREFNNNVYLSVNESHNIIADMDVNNISLTYVPVMQFYGDYKVVASVGDYPIIAVRENGGNARDAQVVVAGINVHRSNFSVMPGEFMIFWLNIFEHFLPPTVQSHAFEVYENIELNARSDSLLVKDASTGGKTYNEEFKTFPSNVSFNVPGTYVLEQTTFANKLETESIYVRCPMAESNIFEKKNALSAPYKPELVEEKYKDFMFYFALALAILLLLEWFLQSRENM